MKHEMRHTLDELRQWQALPLGVKIRMTEQRIRYWVDEYGESGCYVSFSGGKDSTVLLDIVRNRMGYKDVPAVFVDTGLEYPEIREFVKTFDNVVWLKPQMNFKQVIEKYGYPFISKEVSECVAGARKYLTSLLNNMAVDDRQTDRQTDSISIPITTKKVTGTGKYSKFSSTPSIDEMALQQGSRGGTITSIENSEELANILNERMMARSGGNNRRLAIMLGMLTKDKEHPIKANIPNKDRSIFSQEKYKFFLDAPFEISNKCCNVMKKAPVHKYAKESGRYPITAQMAAESRLRTQKWLQNGCNGFNLKEPISNPMAFWTEQDVLHYIKENNIKICSVYGDIVAEEKDQICGQMSLADYNLVEDERKLKTTGCKRTGCMFCGYGCHLEKPGEGRFEIMKKTHPKQYDYIMRPKDQGGLDYKNIIDWINENGGFNIKY